VIHASVALRPRTWLTVVFSALSYSYSTETSNAFKGEDTLKAEEEGSIWEPAENDVLSGRGASVNAHPGNKKFRALCFARKPEFDAGNHAAKRRIATEIVTTVVNLYTSRFLRRKQDKGPWYEMTREQAILKASQVIRDHRRPDRVAQRELMAASGKKRNRSVSTPMDDVVVPPAPVEPIVENPHGVHNNDVLCGRGAFVNGHVGNQQLRTLAIERKTRFDAGNYSDKRALANEVVLLIRSLDPPGRFLRRLDSKKATSSSIYSAAMVDEDDKSIAVQPSGDDPGWQELNEEKSIHKACQVMRDIDRLDRRERDERRRLKKLRKDGHLTYEKEPTTKEAQEASDSIALLAQTTAGTSSQQVMDDAMAAAEEAMEDALELNAGGNNESEADHEPMMVVRL
jgi:hypothetical protein